jgi:hypothetical protein
MIPYEKEFCSGGKQIASFNFEGHKTILYERPVRIEIIVTCPFPTPAPSPTKEQCKFLETVVQKILDKMFNEGILNRTLDINSPVMIRTIHPNDLF